MAANKRIELKESNVIFDKEAHTYQLNGCFLSGITSLLDRQFGFSYENVPKDILEEARIYGTMLHEELEAFDSLWQNSGSQELADYIEICKNNDLKHSASEYLISDGENYASMIDKVYRVSDDTFDLCDVKSFGFMTPEKQAKARWQLSIYAYMFELQNKRAKVGRLFIIHLRNKMKKDGTFDHINDIIFVDRIPSEICKDLLDTDLRGEQFKNPYDIPEDISSQEAEIRELMETKSVVEERLAEIKADILSRMESLDVRSWVTDTMRLTRKLPSTRASFNTALFKAEHPDLDYTPYERVSKVAGSLMITI